MLDPCLPNTMMGPYLPKQIRDKSPKITISNSQPPHAGSAPFISLLNKRKRSHLNAKGLSASTAMVFITG